MEEICGILTWKDFQHSLWCHLCSSIQTKNSRTTCDCDMLMNIVLKIIKFIGPSTPCSKLLPCSCSIYIVCILICGSLPHWSKHLPINVYHGSSIAHCVRRHWRQYIKMLASDRLMTCNYACIETAYREYRQQQWVSHQQHCQPTQGRPARSHLAANARKTSQLVVSQLLMQGIPRSQPAVARVSLAFIGCALP
jgi:hypothetical protein